MTKPLSENPILDLFIPRHSRMNVYLMGIAFILAFATNGNLRSEMGSLFSLSPLWAIALYITVGVSLLYVIVCPFTFGGLDESEKNLMLVFALAVNAYAAVAGGLHLLTHSEGLLLLFPIWNIFNCLFLVLLSFYDIVDTSSIIDEVASKMQLFVGTVLLAVLFYFCQFVWTLHWGITFSICVGNASMVSALVRRVFPPHERYTRWQTKPKTRGRFEFMP